MVGRRWEGGVGLLRADRVGRKKKVSTHREKWGQSPISAVRLLLR